jgi:3-oxoacyl-[acyl-carrier protein] reductase
MTTTQTQTKTSATKKLQGKVALVTGSSRGIGAAIALRLANDGATVAINFVKDENGAKDIVAKIVELGSQASAFKANMASAEESKKLIEEVSKKFGKIDILVNNAGVFEMKPIEEVNTEHYQRLFDVNVKGVITTTVAALSQMSDGGRIINISSVAAKSSMPGASVYSATKAALDALARVWAQELGKRKITVNNVAPGTTETDMLASGLTEELKQMFIAKTALGRLGEAKDIADVVAFLASDDSRWITGQSIVSDGGLLV